MGFLGSISISPQFIGHCENLDDDNVRLLFDEVLNSNISLVRPKGLKIFMFNN